MREKKVCKNGCPGGDCDPIGTLRSEVRRLNASVRALRRAKNLALYHASHLARFLKEPRGPRLSWTRARVAAIVEALSRSDSRARRTPNG